MVTVVEWLVSIACCASVRRSVFATIALALLIGMTPLMGPLFMHFLKKFSV